MAFETMTSSLKIAFLLNIFITKARASKILVR